MRKIKTATSDPVVLAFWENLRHIYTDFDAQHHQLHKVSVNSAGEYVLTQTLL